MSFIIPFIIPMLLGRTYDYNSGQVGVNIFSTKALEESKQSISHHTTSSRFRMVKALSDVHDLLDVSGELSLKVLADVVKVDGMGKYLKESKQDDSTVEILCTVKYETVTETLRNPITALPGWEATDPLYLGSHYIRSLTYGGELLASLKFKTASREEAKKVEVRISAAVGIQGTLDVSVGGQFKKIQEESDGSVNLEITYYGTVPVKGVAQNLEGLTKLIADFPEHVKEVNGGKGIGLRAEIFPLRSLNGGVHLPNFVRNAAIVSQLDDISSKFTDIRGAQQSLTYWVTDLVDVPDALYKEIADFATELENVRKDFYIAANSLEVSDRGDPNQFDQARSTYAGADGILLTGKYTRAFNSLKTRISAKLLGMDGCAFTFPLINAGVFTHNIFPSSKSIRIQGETSLILCKKACLGNNKCKTITYSMAADSSGLNPTIRDRCYLNLFEMQSERLITVPNKGGDVYIYQRRAAGC